MPNDIQEHARACGTTVELFMRRLAVRVKQRGKSIKETVDDWVSSKTPEQSRELMLTSGLCCINI